MLLNIQFCWIHSTQSTQLNMLTEDKTKDRNKQAATEGKASKKRKLSISNAHEL